jgi:hypothetical protein
MLRFLVAGCLSRFPSWRCKSLRAWYHRGVNRSPLGFCLGNLPTRAETVYFHVTPATGKLLEDWNVSFVRQRRLGAQLLPFDLLDKGTNPLCERHSSSFRICWPPALFRVVELNRGFTFLYACPPPPTPPPSTLLPASRQTLYYI